MFTATRRDSSEKLMTEGGAASGPMTGLIRSFSVLLPHRVFVLLCLAGIIYLPTIFNGFVYDEHSLLLPVSAYWSGDIKAVLASPVNGYEYLPVRDLTLLLDAWLWGRNPLGFHLSSLVYYLLAVWVVYLASLRLAELFNADNSGILAWITALLFAFHPLNSEVVYFISARNNILALLFVMTSLIMFIDRRWTWSVLAFILALFSKVSVAYFPLALGVICILWPRQNNRLDRARWLTLGLMLCLNFATIALHFQIGMAEGTVQPDMSRPGVLDIGMTLQRALLVPTYYFYRFLIPWPLNVFLNEGWVYSYSSTWISALLLCSYLASLWLAWKYRQRSILPLVGLVWFYASLGPVSNLFPTYPMFAERYLFQGLFGLSLCLASLLASSGRRFGVAALIAVILVTWGVTVFHRGQDWRTDQSLYGAAYRVLPETAAFPYVVSLLDAGEHVTVKRVLIEGNLPRYLAALAEGEMAANRKDYAVAQTHFDRARAFSVDQSDLVLGRINFMMARNLESLGQYEAAMDFYLRVIDTRLYWGNRFYGQQARARMDAIRGHVFGKKRARLEAAVATDPSNVRAQAEFGLHLMSMGEYVGAVEFLEQARRLEGGNFGILYNLALAYLKQGDKEAALRTFKQADSFSPHHLQLQNHLALLYAGRGDHEQAIALWEGALTRQDDSFTARYNLARLYIRMGETSAAMDLLEQGARAADGELAERYEAILSNLPGGFE